jgi:hypothetical protein
MDIAFTNEIRKVLDLVNIEHAAEPDVDSEDPEVMRELDREVAHGLLRAPQPYSALFTEHAHERRESVIPVVVARDGVKMRLLAAVARLRAVGRGFVGLDEASLVRGRARAGIDLVAAEDQELPAR